MSTLYRIYSLEYSGSTLLDIYLTYKKNNSIGLGETYRAVKSDRSLHKCSCGDDFCKIWICPESYDFESLILKLLKKHDAVIDSSKSLSSLKFLKDTPQTIIFTYRSVSSWINSVKSRRRQQEVKLFSIKDSFYQVIPFIRIEILRKITPFIALEWLYRNTLLLFTLIRYCHQHQHNLVVINFERFTEENDGLIINSSNSHILRGNKISRKGTQIIRRSITRTTNPYYKLLNFSFNTILKFTKLDQKDVIV